MIAISEILIKLYLFGFQSSIYRFANELSESQKNLVLNKLIKRILLISFNVAVFFEVSQKFYWDFIFEFEFGLPMRTAILISTVSAGVCSPIIVVQLVTCFNFEAPVI